jgi:hypothetical protein
MVGKQHVLNAWVASRLYSESLPDRCRRELAYKSEEAQLAVHNQACQAQRHVREFFDPAKKIHVTILGALPSLAPPHWPRVSQKDPFAQPPGGPGCRTCH